MKLTNIFLTGAIALPLFGLAARLTSGLPQGTDVSAFAPYHVTGPDAGTVTCPVCKYGFEPGIQVWVHNISDKNVSFLARNLEAQLEAKGMKKCRAFVVFVEPNSMSSAKIQAHLKMLGKENHLKDLALIYVRSNDSSLKHYQINLSPAVKSTLIAYHQRKTVDNVLNIPASKAGVREINRAVSLAING